jgi:hypothetical protein
MRYREILEACWTGYQQQGMKKKGDRMVPNCVSINEDQEKFILYFNNRPVAQYNTEQEAEYQGRLIQKRVPGTEYEIKKEVCTLTTMELKENLRKWFKEKWVRFGPDGKIRGDCARGSSKEGKPKCLPQSKAQALGKKGRAASAAKKRRQDPNPERRGAAKNVATKVREQSVMEYAGKKSADEIRRIQQMLNTKFDANLDVDGVMGPLTIKTIKKFLPATPNQSAPNPERTTSVQGKELKSEQQLDELQFLGSECTKDCSGHRAGYNWSRAQGGVDGMSPWSPSFNKGAALAKAGK